MLEPNGTKVRRAALGVLLAQARVSRREPAPACQSMGGRAKHGRKGAGRVSAPCTAPPGQAGCALGAHPLHGVGGVQPCQCTLKWASGQVGSGTALPRNLAPSAKQGCHARRVEEAELQPAGHVSSGPGPSQDGAALGGAGGLEGEYFDVEPGRLLGCLARCLRV